VPYDSSPEGTTRLILFVVSVALSYTLFASKSPKSSVLICHCDAPWVSPISGSENAELVSVGVVLAPTALAAGKPLTGVTGLSTSIVVNDVPVDQLDQLA